MHYGVSVKDGSPGRGSGRYPLGSGKKGAIQRVKSAAKSKNKVDEIINTLNPSDREKLGMSVNDIEYLSIEQGEHVIKRVIESIDEIPVSFFELLDDGDTINLALATRSEKEYRGKGYATKAAEQAMNWLDKNPHIRNKRDVIWGVRTDNPGSIAIAKQMGFELDPNSYSDDGKWVNYIQKWR
jgi:GNAT superfamily N-acetyltransferase